MNPELRFREFLKKKELRWTCERLALFRALRSIKGHFTSDALVYRLQKKPYKVSRDTVFRNIPVLVQSGLIRQIYRKGRDTTYEVGGRHHDHLMCTRCGSITEFSDATIERAQEEVAKRLGFNLESHCHELFGVCAKCRSLSERKVPDEK